MEIILIVIYASAMLFVLFYSAVQIQLVIKYVKYKKLQESSSPKVKEDNLPFVTVQLPIFNERYVAKRLIQSIANLNYPNDKLEIQVLDDSTDETKEIIATEVEIVRKKGINIQQLVRKNRDGFKAGALAFGLTKAKGEFIAIFDADFLPKEDFLLKMIPHFKEDKIGMVQSRWEHINENYSLLTKLQAFGLNAHFTVEQGGRNIGGHFINFNGTAGVWRRTTIEEAGGWQSDTLTEDLDLSYRAQLKGWQFKFVENVGAPAELPAEMNALKTQQFRWNKGAAECVRKNLKEVLLSSNISFGTKVNAIFHLMNSAIFICIVILAILSIPMLYIGVNFKEYEMLFKLGAVFILCLPILAIFYLTSILSVRKNKVKAFFEFLILFPVFLAVSMGLSLHNASAVLEGYLGKKTAFIRTPKLNLTNDKSKNWTKNKYLRKQLRPLILLETALAVYFLYGAKLAFVYNDFGMFPFHLMLFLGFSFVVISSLVHSFKTNQ